MKKILIIILVNVFLILTALIAAEIWAYNSIAAKKFEHSKTFTVDKDEMKPFPFVKMKEFEQEYENFEKNSFRTPQGLEYTKKPILLFGCSFTYGYRLNDNQTFSYYLAKAAHRPVYNRGHNAWGLPHMVYQLKNIDFYKQVPEPEYVIYLFSKHHIQMFYDYTFQLWDENICLRYKNKAGKLEKVKNPPKFIQGSYLLKTIYRKFADNSYKCIFSSKDEELALLHFITSKKEYEKHWKNTKFVVLFYDETTETEGFDEKLQNDLRKEGFIVLKMDEVAGFDVSDEKFRVLSDDPHPGEQLWRQFCPKLVKALNL